jgi:diguanylate cyclase (GGDEF)-like protein/PAS domain S-box-containing protein
VTERKTPSDDLFYRELLDNLYDGVYFVDRDRRITYWNKGAERITGYRAEEVLGRRCADNVLMHIDEGGDPLCLGCCPLAETMEDGEPRSREVYLMHKDGHRIPISVRVSSIRDKEGSIAGGVEVFTDNSPKVAVLERVKEFERLAYIDPLTGLANRRYAEISLQARFEELRRYGWPFGAAFVDIDHFKAVNDRFGHGVGDEVLKMVALTLVNSVRSFDVVGRWGGEEFIIVIANVDGAELQASAYRFRALVEQSSLPAEIPLRVTVSVGATIARPEDTIETLLKRVDDLMYRSKAAGRNCVTVDV